MKRPHCAEGPACRALRRGVGTLGDSGGMQPGKRSMTALIADATVVPCNFRAHSYVGSNRYVEQ